MWVSIGLALLLWAWVLFFMNARLSVEFTGGMQIKVNGTIDDKAITADLSNYLTTLWYPGSKVLVEVGEQVSNLALKINVEDDAKVKSVSQSIQDFLVTNKYVATRADIVELSITWPSIGSYMQTTAIKALLIWLWLMVVYMIFAFAAVRKYISPATLAIITIATMIFDISIPAWAYGFWMMINPTVSIDTIFIIAVLTVMWYSINDTIIIFDRIRENMQIRWTQKDLIYWQLFEDSLRQTMRRSFGTVFSTLLVIIAMYFLGTGVIKNFAFTMWVWVLTWSYSSIFISAPLTYIMMGKFKKEVGKIK